MYAHMWLQKCHKFFFFFSVCEVQEIAATCVYLGVFLFFFCSLFNNEEQGFSFSLSRLLPNVVNTWTFEDKFEREKEM